MLPVYLSSVSAFTRRDGLSCEAESKAGGRVKPACPGPAASVFWCALGLFFWLLPGVAMGDAAPDSSVVDRLPIFSMTGPTPGTGVPVIPLCFNINSLLVDDWSNKALIEATRGFNPGVLRIPGGTVANYWDWRKGGLIAEPGRLRDIPRQFHMERVKNYDSAKIEDFKPLLEATGADVALVLNVLNSELEEQLAFIRAAMDGGLPVKYVEIGNEMNLGMANYRDVFPAPQDYAKLAEEWSKAIRKEFPGLKIGVNGANPRRINDRPRSSARLRGWNDAVIETAIPHADGLIIHEYHPGDLPDGREDEDPYQALLIRLFKQSSSMLDRDFRERYPEGKTLWLTEYNLMPGRDQKAVNGQWIHGLYVAVMTALIQEQGDATLACNHVLVGDIQFAAIFADSDEIQIPVVRSAQATLSTTPAPFSLTSSGYALQLYARAIAGMRDAFPVSFTHQGNSRRYRGLHGLLFSDGVRHTLLLFNLTPRELGLARPQSFDRRLEKFEQIWGRPGQLITAPSHLESQRGEMGEHLVLPPYSVTRIYSD